MVKWSALFALSNKLFVPEKERESRWTKDWKISCCTPHATTGAAPCKLFLGRDLRTRLHLLQPQLATRVCNKQAAQKQHHDDGAKTREFFVGQEVMARNPRSGAKYLHGVIIERLGPLSFLVEVKDGLTWRHHIDHLKPLQESSTPGTPSSSQATSDEALEDDVYLPFDSTGTDHNLGHRHCRGNVHSGIETDLPGMVAL